MLGSCLWIFRNLDNGLTKVNQMAVFTHALPTNNYGVAKFIVSATASNGTHTTLASAIAASSSGDIIFVRQGTYTENVTLKAGVTLVGWAEDGANVDATIDGTITCSTAAGTYSISKLNLKNTGAAACVLVSGTVSSVYVNNCNFSFNASGTIGVSNSSSGSVYISNCKGNSTTTGTYPVTNTDVGAIFLSYCRFFNGGASVTPCPISGGSLSVYYCDFPYGTSFTNATTAVFNNSTIGVSGVVAIAYAGSNTSNIIENCYINAIGTAALTVTTPGALVLLNSTIFCNQTPITGNGTISYGTIEFQGSSAISATTQTPFVVQNGKCKTVLPAGDYTVLGSDYFVGATSSAARAISLPATATGGDMYVIKDITGTAGTNNITVSGNGVNILAATSAATYVMDVNYASATFIHTGTVWAVV